MSQPVASGQRLDESIPENVVHYTGPSIAAILAAATSLLGLGIVVLITELSKSASDAVFGLGKAWIAHADSIGPYSGKETVALLVWIVAWPLFHLALRYRNPNVKVSVAASLLMVLLAALFVWPPVWHMLGA